MRSPRAVSVALVQLLHSRQPVTLRDMLIVGGTGMFAGLALAYMAMGTLHAVCTVALQAKNESVPISSCPTPQLSKAHMVMADLRTPAQ